LVDNCTITCKAIESLIENGARKILFLAGAEVDYSIKERHEGYSIALNKHNIPYRKDRVVYNIYDDRSAYTAMNDLFVTAEEPFDALFLSSNYFVYGAMKALKEHGIDIRRMQFAGFEDFSGSDYFFSQFTIVQQPDAQIAEEAFNMLIASMNGTLPDKDIVLPAKLLRI